MSSNDNDLKQSHPTPESYGSAALLLVESLIHGLCENKTLSIGDAVAITERAADVQQDRAEAADGAGAPMWGAHTLLARILTSLKADEAGRPLGA